MGLKVTTDDKGIVIYAKQRTSQAGNTWTSYSTKVSSKDQQGNWQSAFINVMFKKGVEVADKSKIVIKDAFYTVDSYNGNNTLKLVIMDFDVLEGGTPTQAEQPQGQASWMQVPDNVSDGLPFK